ncbi:MAG: TatD family hydrolase [Nitrospinota bacterium]|nr:TatD family hydrolase [Nitrospinota bacterium]
MDESFNSDSNGSETNNRSQNTAKSPESADKMREVYKKTVRGRVSNWRSKWNANKKKSDLSSSPDKEKKQKSNQSSSVEDFQSILKNIAFVDSHAHLSDPIFRKDRNGVIRRAKDVGVSQIIGIGSDYESCTRTVKIARTNPSVFAAVGIHPHDVKKLNHGILKKMKKFIEDPKVVAIGEIGLDYYRNNSPVKAQKFWFREQIKMAIKEKKPIIVHCRSAFDDVYKILSEENASKTGGVIHCFTGDWLTARKFLDLDFYLGAAGPITFSKSDELREVFKKIPLERVLLETDCPYLTPHPNRGKRNEPSYMIETAKVLADLHGVSMEELGKITNANNFRLFGIGQNLKKGVFTYEHKQNLYLNITNQCSNSCFFCGLIGDGLFKGSNLILHREPSVSDVIEEIDDPSSYQEVVFSGFGEPTLRLEVMLEIAKLLKKKGTKKLRLVTNGLGSITNGKDVLPELSEYFDAISVSLQAGSSESYEKICQTKDIKDPFVEVKNFIIKARTFFQDIEVTAVNLTGVTDINDCMKIANELKVSFRSQEFVYTD